MHLLAIVILLESFVVEAGVYSSYLGSAEGGSRGVEEMSKSEMVESLDGRERSGLGLFRQEGISDEPRREREGEVEEKEEEEGSKNGVNFEEEESSTSAKFGERLKTLRGE